MLLAIDIGNTNIKIGVFKGTEIIAHWRVLTERHKLADEYAVLIRNLFALEHIDVSHIHGCVLSCVVPPLMMQFSHLCSKYLGITPLVVGPRIASGLTFDVENPDEMGSDRIANSLAATRTYGSPVIAIAFGTATTFDVVVDNVYVGGCIAPGLGISSDALFSLAARLYQVELVRPPQSHRPQHCPPHAGGGDYWLYRAGRRDRSPHACRTRAAVSGGCYWWTRRCHRQRNSDYHGS